MKKYLVGGAVRDKLLGLEIKDKDYVVIGSTVQKMLDNGFEKVGADFPVFLHPETKEEYALARTERKKQDKNGYHAFETSFSPNTTIEEDLARRDLTINAIAYDEDNKKYIDPFNGMEDLKNKKLKHTTDAFKEDPLRVLRLARFLTRYNSLGFEVAEETKSFCKEMVKNGELNFLTPERVWKEFEKVFLEKNKPSLFFNFLQEIGALEILLPQLNNLKNVPQPLEHHPENCSFIHTMMVLDQTHAILNNQIKKSYKPHEKYSNEEKIACLFAALLHDLGKGITPKEILPRHIGHEEAGIPLVQEVLEKYKTPNLVKKLSLVVCEDHLRVHRALESNHKTLTKLYKKWNFDRNERFLELLTLVCQGDSQGRLTFEKRSYPQREFLNLIFKKAKENKKLKTKEIVEKANGDVKKIQENLYKNLLEIFKKEKPLIMLELQVSYKLNEIMNFNNKNKNSL